MFGTNRYDSESEDDDEKRTLFCANLDDRVTEDLLYEVFLQAGPIESTRIPKDHNGRQRTFGFITYIHKSTVPYAMQLYQGLTLYRKTVTIKFKGSNQPSPMRNFTSTSSCNSRSNYDNHSLRSVNYNCHNESPSLNPFRNSYPPDLSLNSSAHQDNISRHSSSHKRIRTNDSPYKRKSGGGDRDYIRDRDHNRRRHYNNLSDRHSDQRSSGKIRR